MAWIAPIAAAVIGAAGSAAGGAMAGKGGGSANPNITKLPGFQPNVGLQSYLNRLLALNATKQGPSFDDWLKSGGTARLEMQDTGFTPEEAQWLRLTSRQGESIPYVQGSQAGQALTPEQQVYIGRERARRRSRGEDMGPLTYNERLANIYREIEDQQAFLNEPGGDPAERLRAQRRLSTAQGRYADMLEHNRTRWRREGSTRDALGYPKPPEEEGRGIMDILAHITGQHQFRNMQKKAGRAFKKHDPHNFGMGR